MRKHLFLAVCLFGALGVHAQVTLVSPTSISIPVTGNEATLRVYYTSATAVPDITLTNVGNLVAGSDDKAEVKLTATTPSVPNQINWLEIRVRPAEGKLPPGDTQTGALFFGGTTIPIAVTVTRPKPAFSVALKDTDICLSCREPRVLAIAITNTGQTKIEKVQIGIIRFSDAARRHRWVLPATGNCGPKEAAVANTSGAVPACGATTISLDPAQTETILVSIDPPPPFAGDYAATFDVSVPDAQTNSVTATVRTRGPGIWPPLVLFLLLVTAGSIIAHLLEHYFGSGGGQKRAKALISLMASRDELATIRDWASKNALRITELRIAADLDQIDTILRNASERTPVQLNEEAGRYLERLEKRRRLRQRIESTKDPDKINALDAEPDNGTVEEYDKRLAEILEGKRQLRRGEVETEDQRAQKIAEEQERLRRRDRAMTWLRWITLAAVSLASAFLALYYLKCSYGSASDYITTFFWGLGLTAAGNAVIAEGTSKYKPA